MAEAMEMSMELMKNSFEMPQFSRLLERSREWWKGQNIKDKSDFVKKIPQVILFRHEAAGQWQETLTKLRTLPTAKLSATLMEKLHCPKAVAESLTTLTQGGVLDQSGLAKQEQALEIVSREIGSVTGTDAAQIKETILNAAGAAVADRPPPTYKRASNQAPNVSSLASSESPVEPPPPKKEKKKEPVKKTLLEERPDRSRLATSVITGGVAVALLACSVYLWGQIGLNIRQQASGEENIPQAYINLLNKPDVQALVDPRNLAGLTSTDTGSLTARGIDPTTDAKIRVVEGIDLTQVYLKESSAGNWQNLIGFLQTDQPATNEQKLNFLGQQYALQQAGCLSGGHIVQILCDSNDDQGRPKHPGFKNLDDKTKQEYIQKYNAFADQNPALLGFSLQPRNIDRAPGRQQQARAFQAANTKRSNKEFRSTRRLMG